MDTNNLINHVVRSIESTQGTKPEATPEKQLYKVAGQLLTKQEILWNRFTQIYGHKFESAFGTDPNEGWILSLNGLTPGMIKTGLTRMVDCGKYNEWPPTALVFRSLCFPSAKDIGLPDESTAYDQATLGGQKRHPAVIYTMRSMDSFIFRQMSVKASQDAFNKQYQKTIEYVVNGGTLPDVDLVIEESRASTLSKPERLAMLQKLKQEADL